jgi:hypothetical protein
MTKTRNRPAGSRSFLLSRPYPPSAWKGSSLNFGTLGRPFVWPVDIDGTSRRKWTIDFGVMSLYQAAEYEILFEYVRERVYPVR